MNPQTDSPTSTDNAPQEFVEGPSNANSSFTVAPADWEKKWQSREFRSVRTAVLLANNIDPNQESACKEKDPELWRRVRTDISTAESALGGGLTPQSGRVPESHRERLKSRVRLSDFAEWAKLALPNAAKPAGFLRLADRPSQGAKKQNAGSSALSNKQSEVVIGLLALFIQDLALKKVTLGPDVLKGKGNLNAKGLAHRLVPYLSSRTDNSPRSKPDTDFSPGQIARLIGTACKGRFDDPGLWGSSDDD